MSYQMGMSSFVIHVRMQGQLQSVHFIHLGSQIIEIIKTKINIMSTEEKLLLIEVSLLFTISQPYECISLDEKCQCGTWHSFNKCVDYS